MWCGSSVSIKELLFTGTLLGLGTVVHLRSCYSNEHLLLRGQCFIYGASINRIY
jgi:hypothetical protein